MYLGTASIGVNTGRRLAEIIERSELDAAWEASISPTMRGSYARRPGHSRASPFVPANRNTWPGDFPIPPIAEQLLSGDPEGMASFSSRGPCDDRRIKPDIVAPGH